MDPSSPIRQGGVVAQAGGGTGGIYQPVANPTGDPAIAQQELNSYVQANTPHAPQAGQFANSQQGFLDWATKTYGADPTRGQGFVNAQAGGGLANMIKAYTAATGNQAQFLGGPSGDQVSFAGGPVSDALTSGGSIWNPGAGGGPSGAPGGGGHLSAPTGGGGHLDSPTGGSYGLGGGTGSFSPIDAPAPFSYSPSTTGPFQGPAPWQAPSPFQGTNPVPTPAQVGYDPAQAPDPLHPQTLGTPQQLSYSPATTPSAFQYDKFVAPGEFKAPTLADMGNDPAYQYDLAQSQRAIEHSAAAKGTLRSSNTLLDLSKDAMGRASAEYANLYGRKKSEYDTSFGNALTTNTTNNQGGANAYGLNTSTALNYNVANNQGQNAAAQGNTTNTLNYGQANNQNLLNFGNSNFQNQFSVNQANNQGHYNATQANNASAAAAQAAGYGQAANTYGLNTTTAQGAQAQAFGQAATGYGLNQGAQQQAYNQALGAYTTNTGNLLNFGNANNANALGWGNLGLGYQNSANSYSLGQGNLALGQGQLGLQQQGQQFNQDLSTFNTNYQTQVMNPWNMNMQLYTAGNPGAPNYQQYGTNAGNTIEGQGNANAAGQVGSQNAWGNYMTGLTNNLMTLANTNTNAGGYQPGYGMPPLRR